MHSSLSLSQTLTFGGIQSLPCELALFLLLSLSVAGGVRKQLLRRTHDAVGFFLFFLREAKSEIFEESERARAESREPRAESRALVTCSSFVFRWTNREGSNILDPNYHRPSRFLPLRLLKSRASTKLHATAVGSRSKRAGRARSEEAEDDAHGVRGVDVVVDDDARANSFIVVEGTCRAVDGSRFRRPWLNRQRSWCCVDVFEPSMQM